MGADDGIVLVVLLLPMKRPTCTRRTQRCQEQKSPFVPFDAGVTLQIFSQHRAEWLAPGHDRASNWLRGDWAIRAPAGRS